MADLERASALFAEEWRRAEAAGPVPVHVRDVRVVDYADFAARVASGDRAIVRDLVESFYAGDGYVIKGAYDREFTEAVIARSIAYANRETPTFHKMYDGTPDFHRFIEESVAGNYGAHAIRHVFHFYAWNDDPVGMVAETDRRWTIFKTLSGLGPRAYVDNRPSDGVIDRYHVYHYPSGGGSNETHSDPTKNQRTIIAAMMSKRGMSYHEGGFYFVDAEGRHQDCEPFLDVGDIVTCYASVYHGVAKIDPESTLDWDPARGRWFLGLYSVDSDHVKDRTTVIGVKANRETERIA